MVGVEYHIPITTRRIDFLIAEEAEGKNNIVVIKLKQWDKVEKSEIESFVYLDGEERVHPSWQAYSYTSAIQFYNEAIEKYDI